MKFLVMSSSPLAVTAAALGFQGLGLCGLCHSQYNNPEVFLMSILFPFFLLVDIS
jgi:hypothetical protein